MLFYKETEAHGVFSQYSKSTIVDWLDRTWTTGEQFMHAMKALFFGDMKTFAAISALGYDPAAAKALGRQVSPFDPDAWAAVAIQVVTYGTYLKFSQCPARQNMLLDTGDADLIECAPHDKIWGIGRSVEEFENGAPRNGSNHLGNCLASVRATLTARKTVEPGELTSFGQSVAGGSAVPEIDQERAWLDTFSFPLTTVAGVKRLLRGRFAPTVLIGFEFSGALRSAFELRGYRALSCDLRDCELGGMHARLDVFLLAHERVWDIVVLHPPCQNILRKDAACLSAKMNDGRAFWACMVVLHCICIAAHASIVEQPDTIYSDFGQEPYVQLCTSTFNDAPKKTLRLYMRNLVLQPAPSFAPSLTKRLQSRPDHFAYQNPDTRDRARSSWAPFTNLCKAVAALLPTLLHCKPPGPGTGPYTE